MNHKEKEREKGKHIVNALVKPTTSFSHAAKVHSQLLTLLHHCSDRHVESWKQSLQLLEM